MSATAPPTTETAMAPASTQPRACRESAERVGVISPEEPLNVLGELDRDRRGDVPESGTASTRMRKICETRSAVRRA